MSVTSSDLIIRLLLDLSFKAGLGLPAPNPGAMTVGGARPSAFEANTRLLFGGDEDARYSRR